MIITCPNCYLTGGIEAFTADAEASEFVNLAGQLPPSTWRALLAYIGLFRTARKMPFAKAAKLARETVALSGDLPRLELAMTATVESIRAKREQGAGKAMANHNYLKKVLADTPASTVATSTSVSVNGSAALVTGKRAQAIQILSDWGAVDPIRSAIAQGLSALLALNLDNAPGADTIHLTADIWHHVLSAIGVAIPDVDAPRVAKAFSILLGKPLKKWPEPSQLKDHLPRRPERAKIRHEPEISKEQIKRDREAIKEYLSKPEAI